MIGESEMTPEQYKAALKTTLVPKETFKTNAEKLAESKAGWEKIDTRMGIKRRGNQ
jgi:hypothetical protein